MKRTVKVDLYERVLDRKVNALLKSKWFEGLYRENVNLHQLCHLKYCRTFMHGYDVYGKLGSELRV